MPFPWSVTASCGLGLALCFWLGCGRSCDDASANCTNYLSVEIRSSAGAMFDVGPGVATAHCDAHLLQVGCPTTLVVMGNVFDIVVSGEPADAAGLAGFSIGVLGLARIDNFSLGVSRRSSSDPPQLLGSASFTPSYSPQPSNERGQDPTCGQTCFTATERMSLP
jgi:hypothetical protein